MSKKFMRRSLLFIPGSSEKMLSKASQVNADSIILDLEDSVSLSEKNTARDRVAAKITALRSGRHEVIVRVNAMDTREGILDLLTIGECCPDAVIIPKADEQALIIADGILNTIEDALGKTRCTISIIPLFETAYSIATPLSILNVSPRIDGVQLGAEDLTKEMGVRRTLKGEEIGYARHQLSIAGRAKKIDVLDTPYTGIQDLEGLHKDAENAKQIGFTGKTCIHPNHILTINEVFSPSPEEVAYARGLLEAYDAAIAEGKGACTYQNKMIDVPVAERARQIIDKAERIQKILE